MADWREDYQARRILGVRALRAFPRSAGLITTAVYAVVTLDPIFALGPGFSVWLVLRIINWVIAVVMPDIVDRNLWSCCLYLVVPVGAGCSGGQSPSLLPFWQSCLELTRETQPLYWAASSG